MIIVAVFGVDKGSRFPRRFFRKLLTSAGHAVGERPDANETLLFGFVAVPSYDFAVDVEKPASYGNLGITLAPPAASKL